ncbi:hypothetical protein [Planktothrix agardhii]|nr:hypothetical protein [Planktothrix agardhii]CAD0226418.1 conserved hypothetical protein [Planktothrix agardhii]
MGSIFTEGGNSTLFFVEMLTVDWVGTDIDKTDHQGRVYSNRQGS